MDGAIEVVGVGNRVGIRDPGEIPAFFTSLVTEYLGKGMRVLKD